LVISFDPMLEEFVAALIVSRSLEAVSLEIAKLSSAPAYPLPQPPVKELP
jgi:hypothetical protein